FRVAPLRAVFVGVAEARFALEAVVLLHLRRVLACLELEELMHRASEQRSNVAVQISKELVLIGLALALTRAEPPLQGGAIKLPTCQTNVCLLPVNEAIRLCGLEQRADDVRVGLVIDVLVVGILAAPTATLPEEPAQTRS